MSRESRSVLRPRYAVVATLLLFGAVALSGAPPVGQAAPASPTQDSVSASALPVLPPSITWNTTQLTFNNHDDQNCQIDGPWLLWESFDGNDWEIYLYLIPTGTTIQLTNNPWDDTQAVLRGDWVTWTRYDGDSEIWLYQISTDTRQAITNNALFDITPDVFEGWVTWSALSAAEYEVFLCSPAGAISNISNTPYGDHRPRIDGDHVVWEYADGAAGDPSKDVEIFLYEISTTTKTQLTSNSVNDEEPWIDSGRIVWKGLDGTDTDIFYLDTSETPFPSIIQLTTDPYDDFSPRISGDHVVWEGRDAGGDGEIYVHHLPSGITDPVTSNTYDEWFFALDEDLAAWSPHDGNDWEVYARHLEYGVTSRLTDNSRDDGFATSLGAWGLDTGDGRVTWIGFDGNDWEVFLATPTITPAFMGTFVDVTALYPYAEAIEGIAQAGIVNGYEPAPGVFEFRPESPVRRAQFAKMICGARHIPVNTSMMPPFLDLGPDPPGDLYPHQYVAAAADYGITTGVTPTTFNPWGDSTRAQVITMVMRSLYNDPQLALMLPPASYAGTLGNFSPIHGPAMRHAEYLGLLDGIEGFGPGWNPWQPATRGEVAVILWYLIAN